MQLEELLTAQISRKKWIDYITEETGLKRNEADVRITEDRRRMQNVLIAGNSRGRRRHDIE